MRLQYAPAAFQALMNLTFFAFIDKYVLMYINYFFVFSDTKDERLRNLGILFLQFYERNLYVGWEKYELMSEENELSGLQTGRSRMSVGGKSRRMVWNWSKPSTKSDLCTFLELPQLFERFIYDFSLLQLRSQTWYASLVE